MKSKAKRPISTVIKGDVVELWLGEPDEPESERIMAIHLFWVDDVIAALKSLGSKGRKD